MINIYYTYTHNIHLISNHLFIQQTLAENFLHTRLCPKQGDTALNKRQPMALCSLWRWPGWQCYRLPFLAMTLSYWQSTFTFILPPPQPRFLEAGNHQSNTEAERFAISVKDSAAGRHESRN